MFCPVRCAGHECTPLEEHVAECRTQLQAVAKQDDVVAARLKDASLETDRETAALAREEEGALVSWFGDLVWGGPSCLSFAFILAQLGKLTHFFNTGPHRRGI